MIKVADKRSCFFVTSKLILRLKILSFFSNEMVRQSKKVRMDVKAQTFNYICCTLINSGEAVAASINCFLWATWLLFTLNASSGRKEKFFVGLS